MKRIARIEPATRDFLTRLANIDFLPKVHQGYLQKIKDSGFEPKVIYDIGAAVCHWSRHAERIWPDSEVYLFDALRAAEFLYEGKNYNIGVLSDSKRVIEFYENNYEVGGNSYYRESTEFNPKANEMYSDTHKVKRIADTLDNVVAKRGFPLPDLIKIDVQGCEIDILKGATETLKNCKHLIVELQHVQYNVGAPTIHTSIGFINDLGFRLVTPQFSMNILTNKETGEKFSVDADYHFMRD